VLTETSHAVPRPLDLTILVLDGTDRSHAITAALTGAFRARVITASNLESLSLLARTSGPDIAILGSDHSADEKSVATQLLREMNPNIKIIRL
jgi:hypothetical protein